MPTEMSSELANIILELLEEALVEILGRMPLKNK